MAVEKYLIMEAVEEIDRVKSLNVQFTDMLVGAVQSHSEFESSDSFNKLGKSLGPMTLYF